MLGPAIQRKGGFPMSKFGQSVFKVVNGAAQSFARFPAAMLSALVIAGSASYLIQLDSVTYNKFYQSLQLGFVLAAALGMVATAIGFSRRMAAARFWAVNVLTLVVGALSFTLINGRSGDIPFLTVARIFAGAAVLLFVFLLLISRQKTGSDFNQASFMTLKSAMIALLYGLVILLGLFFIAFSVESLLYENMSEKVYQHIGVWSAFLWFAFFLGYFPDFSPEVSDPHLETAQKQPRFIEILFLYVLIPIIAALTVVLLIWVVQILIVGKWPEFEQLAAIFSGYSILGIWLFIMVSGQDKPIARWFRRLYPIVLLVFLAFEAYAIVDRVRAVRFQTGEYVVSLVWIYALLSALVLLFWPVVRNRLTAVVAMVLIAVSVLPVVGYLDFTVKSQTNRLYEVLTRNQMIAGDRIRKAPAEVSIEDRRTITNTVYFLQRQREETRIADWFTNSITEANPFLSVFGFDETYDWGPVDGQPIGRDTYLMLPQGTLDLTGYQYGAFVSDVAMKDMLEIKGKTGIYQISPLSVEYQRGVPIVVRKDGQEVVKIDIHPFVEGLHAKYRGLNVKEGSPVAFEEMTLKAESGSLRVLIVFNSIQISESGSGTLNYSAYIRNVYLGE